MPPSPPAWCLRRGMCRWENWYKVMMFTCWHVSRASCLTCVTCFVRFGSLLARLVHMVPWFVWMVQVSVSECKYCFQAICSSHVLQVVYIEIWWNCARLLVHIVVDCGWKIRLCISPAAISSNALLIFWLPLECRDDSSLRLYLYSFFLYRLQSLWSQNCFLHVS